MHDPNEATQPDATSAADEPNLTAGTSTEEWPADASAPAPQSTALQSTATAPRRRRMWPTLVAVVLSAALIGGGLAYGLSANHSSGGPKPPAIALVQGTRAAPVSSAAAMIQRILPSVVNVRVTEVSVGQFGGTETNQAEGSGVVLSKDGLIVTNAHVVTGATSVKVVFTNGHPALNGTVLGIDTGHDLAVVKVNANDLVPITVGRSSTLKLVDDVYAIGFPLDLGPTVTRGVISGLNRSVDVTRPDGTTEHLVGMLQTDAAINPGNSGGALVDAAGQLVGINTAGAQAGEAENVGFAIAIDGAVPIVKSLATGTGSNGQRPWLGVQVATPAGQATALAQYGLPAGTRGAVVVTVVQGGPAAKAGLQAGDVIVKVGSSTIGSDSDLHDALSKQKPGDRIQLTLVSRSGQRTATVTLGTFPANLPQG